MISRNRVKVKELNEFKMNFHNLDYIRLILYLSISVDIIQFT